MKAIAVVVDAQFSRGMIVVVRQYKRTVLFGTAAAAQLTGWGRSAMASYGGRDHAHSWNIECGSVAHGERFVLSVDWIFFALFACRIYEVTLCLVAFDHEREKAGGFE